MTLWATLWYAGAVVFSMGYEGQTLEQCNQLGQIMMYDISTAYADPELKAELLTSMFPVDLFSFTCETSHLPVDQKYIK